MAHHIRIQVHMPRSSRACTSAASLVRRSLGEVADIAHANIWIEAHWRGCKRSLRDSEGRMALAEAKRP
jgi:hypothetical protein